MPCSFVLTLSGGLTLDLVTQQSKSANKPAGRHDDSSERRTLTIFGKGHLLLRTPYSIWINTSRNCRLNRSVTSYNVESAVYIWGDLINSAAAEANAPYVNVCLSFPYHSVRFEESQSSRQQCLRLLKSTPLSRQRQRKRERRTITNMSSPKARRNDLHSQGSSNGCV